MGRHSEPIRARRGPRGLWLISYVEDPGRSHTTPIPCYPGETTEGRLPAIAWAKRNRERLLATPGKPLALRNFCSDFFEPDSPWVIRMRAKGHRFGNAYLATRQGHVDNYILPLFGMTDPRELTGRYIDDALLSVTRKGGEPLAPATKYKINYSLNIILEDLVERKIIPTNPLAGIRSYSKTPVMPRGALPRDVLPLLFPNSHGELVRIWGGSMWASCMLVLLDSGMRPGELRALRWHSLYGDERAFVVRYAIESGTVDTLKCTKNETVKAGTISLRTAQELTIWRSESRHAQGEDFVFTLNGKLPLTNAGIGKAFRRGLAAVGLEDERWTPYWLRHSFVTYSMAALSEYEVSMLAGHSVEVDRIYQHPDDDIALARSREARLRLDEARG